MEPTEDPIKAATKKLDKAIETFMEDTGWNKHGILASWILAGHQVSFDDGGDELGTYPIWFKGGSQPHHINIGLLNTALDALKEDRMRRLSDNE